MHPPETPSIGLPESTARHGSREGSTPRNRGRGKGRGRGGKGRGGGGEEGVEARRATPIGADGDATPEVAVEGEATMTARAIESAAINENHDSNNTNPDLSNTALSANNMLGVSHLGPAMVEAFYEDGSVFGYQELEQAPAPPPVEENSNDFHGPLESFYRAYFAQHPCDAYESDVSSTYDDDGEDADEDTVEIIMEPMHVSTNIPAGDPSSSKRRRLDDRTVILGSTQQDVVSDVVEGEKQDVKSHLMSKIPMQRKEQETSEDRYARVGLEMNRQLCLAARLESAKAIDPTRTELTASEMYTIELMHSTRRAVADAGKARRQQLAPSTKVSYDSYARHWRVR
ncbi:hypothetical protein F5H01DRAFT_63359 [Linnemannia elongata]|nr:hypothetical protein F5H01DRAFT_63359 [Linnemannia elongata]